MKKINYIQLDTIIKILDKEIKWCNDNKLENSVSDEFRNGFIKGLEQGKELIIKSSKEV